MVSPSKSTLVIFLGISLAVFFFAYTSRTTTAEVRSGPKEITILRPPVQNEGEGKGRYEYVEITSSCTAYEDKRCVRVHSGPGVDYETVYTVENGMLLRVKNEVVRNGETWYQIYFDETLRYPDRVQGEWYIPAFSGRIVYAGGEELLTSSTQATDKRIVVDLSDHMLYAYDGNEEFMRTKVAIGSLDTPTPTGTFTIYKKTPSRYMQGPLPGVTDVPFDLPGVPWNLYFSKDGAVIHGTYWHDRYGTGQSDGCINLPPDLAKLIYEWAPLGTKVTIVR